MRSVMVCLGTRPEVIKLAPVIERLKSHPDLDVVTIAAAQHRQLLDQMLATFRLEPDDDLDLMHAGQSLASLTGAAVVALAGAIERHAPDAVVVQGDTTTALCAALAAYYAGVPVGHVEAGLRTYDTHGPFPEEANRRMISAVAHWHWAPTERNARALVDEGVDPARVLVTGNTVIDALLSVARRPLALADPVVVPPKRAAKRVLVTIHRRETQGDAQRALCRMLAEVAARPDTEILFPVHLSPAVRAVVFSELAGAKDVHLTGPMNYHTFVHAMKSSDLIATDSGGIQEEAPVLGIPVIVMRDATERVEGVEAGCARLAGSDVSAVRRHIDELLDDERAYAAMARAKSPYGDGHAAERIVSQLARELVAGGRLGAARDAQTGTASP